MASKKQHGPAKGSPHRLVQRLLDSACAAAKKSRELQDQLAPLLLERYGISPSDVDCDHFIEGVCYGHGGVDLCDLDSAMAQAGHPPLNDVITNAASGDAEKSDVQSAFGE